MSVMEATLGDVAEFIRGITFKPDDVVELGEEGSVACLRTKNVQTDLDLSDVWAIPRGFVKSAERFVRAGDLIISTANSWNLVGKAAWIPQLEWEAAAGGFVSILRAHPQKVFPRYLYHWIVTDQTQANLRKCARQTTSISNLSIPQALELKIPLPPLEEQKRIAGILDQADALRRLRARALDKLNTLGQAIFHEMFGAPHQNPFEFPKAKLGEIIKFIGGSQPPKKYFLYEDGPDRVRFVQTRDFRTDDYPTYVPSSLAKRPFTSDDVIIGRYGPPVFQIFRGLSGTYNVALMKAEPKGETLKDFIYFLLKEPTLHGYVVANSERTGGQTGVNLALLNEYPVYSPPLGLQQEFSRRIIAVSAQLDQQRYSLQKVNSLFASLQHRAFRGEL